jgi:glycosyltransferase involved in cell wall biosynthesis
MLTLGLGMIVKDEPVERLAMLVEFLKPVVDQYVIVDTGSKDYTIDAPLITSWGVESYQFEWVDDFSAARNETLKYLTTDWVLALDADELPTLDMMFSLQRIKEECDPATKGWLFMTQNFWGGEKGIMVEEHWHCRLFRRTSGKWYRRIHELVSLDNVQESGTRGSLVLPKANASAYLIHSKPREAIDRSASLYNKIGAP